MGIQTCEQGDFQGEAKQHFCIGHYVRAVLEETKHYGRVQRTSQESELVVSPIVIIETIPQRELRPFGYVRSACHHSSGGGS